MPYPNQYVPIEQRFWDKVDATGDCWEWTGERNRAGYGLFRIGTVEGKRPRVGSHRWVWEHLVGPIPDDLVIDHLCKNHSCVNPDHLEAVPQRINLLRANTFQARNSRKVVCPRGHWYSPENTYQKTTGRTCRTCARFLKQRLRAQAKVEGRVYG